MISENRRKNFGEMIKDEYIKKWNIFSINKSFESNHLEFHMHICAFGISGNSYFDCNEYTDFYLSENCGSQRGPDPWTTP